MREQKSMAVLSWFCSNNTKNMFVKIVHPCGHVELHDRPITASDVVARNPKCCLAFPNVFKQPWAIVEPETILMPGQKFYVVPLSTVRRLQVHAMRYSRAQFHENDAIQNFQGEIHENGDSIPPQSCPKQFSNRGRGIRGEKMKGREGQQLRSSSCCTCLRTGMMKIKARDEDKNKEITLSNSFGSSENLLQKKQNNKDLGGISANSPKQLSTFHQWQPSLKSISEEYE